MYSNDQMIHLTQWVSHSWEISPSGTAKLGVKYSGPDQTLDKRNDNSYSLIIVSSHRVGNITIYHLHRGYYKFH